MKRDLKIFLTTLALAAMAPAACGDAGDPGSTGAGTDGSGSECIPGQTEACMCDDGSEGAMSCPDHGRFDPCVCEGSSDATSAGTSDGSAGTSDGSATSGGTTTDSGGTTGSSGGSTTGVESCDPNDPSWSNCIVPILYKSCGAGTSGCHNREAYGAQIDSDCRGWSSFEDVPLGAEFYAGDKKGELTGCPDRPLHERIVNFAPWQCGPDTDIVTPGNPDASYMWRKITGQNLCDAGNKLSDPMPPPESMIEISAEDQMYIKTWIENGAKYDE